MKTQKPSFAAAKHVLSLIIAISLIWLGITIKQSTVEANSKKAGLSQNSTESEINKQ